MKDKDIEFISIGIFFLLCSILIAYAAKDIKAGIALMVMASMFIVPIYFLSSDAA